jgi:PAS domain S-box-containing protein
MSLRVRAAVLSLLPLVLLFALAIPEVSLQRQALRATEAAQRAAAISAASSDLLNARVAALLEARKLIDGAARTPGAYDAASNAFEGATIRLAAAAGDTEDPVALRRLAASFSALDRMLDRIAALGAKHERAAALALYQGPAYAAALGDMQRAVAVFAQHARDRQNEQAASMKRLWTRSLIILVVGIIAILGVAVLTFVRASRLVAAINALVDKTARYRAGEPLGDRTEKRDEVGQLDGALHDLVAARDEPERQLRLYRLQAEVTSDVILFIDRHELTIIDANPAATVVYGYPHSELIGMPTGRLHALDDPLDSETIARSDSQHGLAYEGRHARADGTVFPVEVHARTAELEGRPIIVKTIRDISERYAAAQQLSKALQEAVDASRLKSDFVATISHELRTPMHGVIGMSELLLQTNLTDRQREYAVTMRDSATSLLTIVDDVLDFAKLEAGKIELEAIVFDPRQVVNAVLAVVRGTLRGKPLALHAVVSSHVPAQLRGDVTRIRQVLLNLVGNAAKFTEDGSITVGVSIERDEGKTIVLAFEVDDTGIGVAPAARAHLFDAFVQGDGSTTRRFGGSGLGLSICRQLVELMGGRIWLAEKHGAGSTFCFTVRLERAGETGALEDPAPGTLRVLVVDGDEGVRGALSAAVAGWGMYVEAAGDAETARTRLRAAAAAGRPFDAAVVDFVLPRTDGLQLVGEIRSDPAFGTPACILVTAFEAVGRREAAMAAGCSAYLAKPVDPSALYEALAAIERSRGTPASAGPERTPSAPVFPEARILLVEDSALVRHVAALQLAEIGYQADIVESGPEALRAVSERVYDVILMDVRMPGMDGLETTRAIRARERESGRHAIVVALTANVQPADRQACIDAGMDQFLAKPLRLDALRAVLERWLPQHG